MKRALISGGGIAGLTSAYWLQKLGWKTLIVEKAPKVRTEGYMIYSFGNGWRVAERMGLIKEISNIKYPMEKLQYVNSQGRPYFTISLKQVKKAFKGKYNFILRSDLERILSKATLESGAEIRYGTQINQIHEKSDSIEAEFNDGTTSEFDIIIGADGIHSKLRTTIYGDEETSTYNLGYVISVFHTPKKQEIDHSFKIYREPGRQAGFYHLSEDIMDAIFMFRYSNNKNISATKKKEILLDVYKNSGWIVKEVLEKTPEEKISLFDNIEQIRIPKWSKGRVVLIGDACACLSPVAGQGASMAMLEAYILAKELNKHGSNYNAAFSAYESYLKPDIEKRQRQAENLAKNFVPSSNLSLLYNRWLNRIAFSRIFINLTAKSLTGKTLIDEGS
jgi:2-polyprenyl-6-methoxyphenol hydroxylase-like FAD-dependent oxidoreductase